MKYIIVLMLLVSGHLHASSTWYQTGVSVADTSMSSEAKLIGYFGKPSIAISHASTTCAGQTDEIIKLPFMVQVGEQHITVFKRCSGPFEMEIWPAEESGREVLLDTFTKARWVTIKYGGMTNVYSATGFKKALANFEKTLK